MIVTIPSRPRHEGMYSVTLEISDFCPKCGARRGIHKWPGLSYDGSRRLNVTQWTNECEHIDKYEDVFHEEGVRIVDRKEEEMAWEEIENNHAPFVGEKF